MMNDKARLNRLQEGTLLANIPRGHRYILDADAKYNPLVIVDGYDGAQP